MNIDELLLNINNIGMETRVWQTEIQTEEEKAAYQNKGYMVYYTEAEFRKTYPGIDPAHVCYTPSISYNSLYFNEETLAACCLPFVGVVTNDDILSPERIQAGIERVEAAVAAKEFHSSILSLPDRMRFSYFEMLVDKYGSDIPGFYQLFFGFYQASDYGFSDVSKAVVDAALAAKTEEDIAITEANTRDLPDVVTIYRGGNSASTMPDEAYSWTTDINVANFFAARRGTEDGYIVKAEVERADIIEYYPKEWEREVIVSPENVRVTDNLIVYGEDFLDGVSRRVINKYHEYKEKLNRLRFAQHSDVHGKAHELRVLLLSLMIADELGVSDADMDVLATAAIYHDTQRVTDGEDPTHGKASREYYVNNVDKSNLLTAILCEYHCLPDEFGHSVIAATFKNKEKQLRYIRLFNIFKDADALDRVRFGLQDLDLNQLRIPVSRQLSLIARICLGSVKE